MNKFRLKVLHVLHNTLSFLDSFCIENVSVKRESERNFKKRRGTDLIF